MPIISAFPSGNGDSGTPVVTTAGSGSAYTATVSGITALKAGMMLTIIPHVASASTTPTLNVNSLGAYGIRRQQSTYTTGTTAGYTTTWLTANKPVLLQFDGTYWVAVGKEQPMAADLNGTLTVAKGGTGKTSWTTNRLIYPSSTTAFTQMAAPSANGSVLMQDTSGAPYWSPSSDMGGDKVGDIKITKRTDLGDKYLLCNGANVNVGSYSPELSKYTTHIYPYSLSSRSINSTASSVHDIIYANGYYAAVATVGTNITLLYTQDLDTTWKSKTIASVNSSGQGAASIAYGNGYWVIVYTTANTNTYPKVAYSTSIDGTWTTSVSSTYLGSGSGGSEIIYQNGYFAIATGYSDSALRVYYGTNPATIESSWNYVELSTYSSTYTENPVFFSYQNGYFIVITHKNNSSRQIYYSSSLSSGWSNINSYNINNSAINPRGMYYMGGYWVIPCTNTKIAYKSGSISESGWSVKQISTSYTSEQIKYGAYIDGYFMFFGVASNAVSVYYSTSITGTFQRTSFSNVRESDDSGSNRGIGAICCTDTSVVCLVKSSSEYAAILYSTAGDYLPTISIPETYCYIRVKE